MFALPARCLEAWLLDMLLYVDFQYKIIWMQFKHSSVIMFNRLDAFWSPLANIWRTMDNKFHIGSGSWLWNDRTKLDLKLQQHDIFYSWFGFTEVVLSNFFMTNPMFFINKQKKTLDYCNNIWSKKLKKHIFILPFKRYWWCRCQKCWIDINNN